jgi:hypothetical protein
MGQVWLSFCLAMVRRRPCNQPVVVAVPLAVRRLVEIARQMKRHRAVVDSVGVRNRHRLGGAQVVVQRAELDAEAAWLQIRNE